MCALGRWSVTTLIDFLRARWSVPEFKTDEFVDKVAEADSHRLL